MTRPLLILVLLLGSAGCGARGHAVGSGAAAAAPPEIIELDILDLKTLEQREASAFRVRPDIIVTCHHVLPEGPPVASATVPGAGDFTMVTEALASCRRSDLALLRVKRAGVPLPLMDPDLGLRGPLWAVTRFGVTRVEWVAYDNDGVVGDVIIVNAPGLGPGASGGALLDRHGRVAGVIRGAFDDDPTECVVVPVARLVELLHREGL
jgi:S1-C subfamily serine protease